jgi:7-carboxy-7-deazaguanine synthase
MIKNTLKVNEIFCSIQGESSLAGFPCILIRLTGCNLRCSYCDTRYAYDEGEVRSVDDIIEQTKTYGFSLVEITGGEPLLQEDTPALIRRLLNARFQVLLETNGSIDISSVDSGCIRIIDIKLPSSGESKKNRLENFAILRAKDELKFVIGDQRDYHYAKEVLSLIPEDVSGKIVVNFSPVSEKMKPRQLAEWILGDRLGVRLNLQLHKIIWPEHIRGF